MAPSLAGAQGPWPDHEAARPPPATVPRGVPLSSFRAGLERARSALADDCLMSALDAANRDLLRDAFDGLTCELERHGFDTRTLHGEPHDGNWLMTSSGLRWIDFEAVCSGPLEWDLAFLSGDACSAFDAVDAELWELLRILNSPARRPGAGPSALPGDALARPAPGDRARAVGRHTLGANALAVKAHTEEEAPA